jgi:hypothetical protein
VSAPTLNDLAELPVWLAWQGEAAGKPGAPPRKVPYATSGSGRRASATDPKTWGPRQAATARAAALPKPCGLGGVGIVLTALDDGTVLCGIDLDTCCVPTSRNLEFWAEETLVGRDRAGTALVVAVRCCRGRLRSLLGCGLFLAARDLPGPWLADVQPWGSA